MTTKPNQTNPTDRQTKATIPKTTLLINVRKTDTKPTYRHKQVLAFKSLFFFRIDCDNVAKINNSKPQYSKTLNGVTTCHIKTSFGVIIRQHGLTKEDTSVYLTMTELSNILTTLKENISLYHAIDT